MHSRRDLLSNLSFGRVDAESLEDLDRRFVKTHDFDTIVNDDTTLILGPKGSGKSTIFELLSRFEDTAASLANGRLDDVRIVTGTGLLDLGELATDDIEQLKGPILPAGSHVRAGRDRADSPAPVGAFE